MKNKCFLVPILVFGFCLANPSPARSQTALVNGMVTGVTQSEIQVKPASAASSMRISYGSSTTLTDEVGNPISMSRVTQGQHVMVYYGLQGDKILASKIILKTVLGANVQGGATQKRALNNSMTR